MLLKNNGAKRHGILYRAFIMLIIVILSLSAVSFQASAASDSYFGPLPAIDSGAWTAIAPVTFTIKQIYKLGDRYYIPLMDTLQKMGYNPAAGGGFIYWDDPLLGHYWTDGNYIYGPEIIFKLSGKFTKGGKTWIPIYDLAYAIFWTATWDSAAKTVSIERLRPSDIVVNKTEQLGHLYGTDVNGIRKEMRIFLVSTGKYFDRTPSRNFTPTRLPLNKQNKYFFTGPNCWIKWAVQLYGNICVHTIYTSSKYDLDTPSMQHGYEDIGNRASNGCIRTLFAEARLIWSFGSQMGIKVIDGVEDGLYTSAKAYLLSAKPDYQVYIDHMKLYE